MVVLLHMELDYMGQDLLWNKTIWKKTILLHKEQDYLKQLSFHMETYYVIKWLFSAAQISEITCFLPSKVIKKQQIRLFIAPPPPSSPFPLIYLQFISCLQGVSTLYIFLIQKKEIVSGKQLNIANGEKHGWS